MLKLTIARLTNVVHHMDMDFHLLTDRLEPDVWSAYIVGVSAVSIAIWQFKRTFKLNKKAAVFEELSKDIQEASDNVSSITTATGSMIDQLAAAANSAVYDPTGKTPEEQSAEFDRRITTLNNIAGKQKEYITTIYDSYGQVLRLIRKIEKSTLVKEKTRQAARHLYYAATEQHELTSATSAILTSINVTPIPGENPNINPDTFNKLGDLIGLISPRNQLIGAYLNDLEVILHNDLVRPLYGKSKIQSIPKKHLGHAGISDRRALESLL